MTADVESMFSAREKPWHYNMTKDVTAITDDVLTAADAIVMAGLDWTVAPEEVFLADGTPIPERFAIVRSTDRKVLGTVSDRYVPIQNAEVFSFADNLVDSGEAKYETAGSLKGGKHVFMMMELPREMAIGGDEHRPYICLTTSHDGTRAVTAFPTIIRVVCSNTLTMALDSAVSKWSLNHITTLEGKVHEARETLDLTFTYLDAFEDMAERFLATELSDKRFRTMLTKVLPDRPKTVEAIDNIVANRNVSSTIADDQRSTAWGAYNALTEYFDWTRPGAQGGEARFISVTSGGSARARTRLGAMLQAVAV